LGCVGGEHGGGTVVSDLGLCLNVDRDCVGLGDVHDVLHVLGHMADDIDVLDDFLGDVDVTHNLDLYGGVNVTDNVHGLVDNLGLGDVVGSVNINNLDLGNVSDLFDLNNLGHVLDDFVGLVHIGGHGHVTDLLLHAGLDLGHVSDDLELTFLDNNLGNVSNDLLDLRNLHILDGDRDVDGHGGLDVLDLGHGDGHLADLGHGSNNGHLDLLVNVLGHVDGAVNDDLTGHVADLSDLDLDRAGHFAVLDDLNGHILVHNLLLGHLYDTLNRDGAGDLLGDLNILDNCLNLNLGHFHNALYGFLHILDLGHLNDALLGDDLGNVDNAFLVDNLGLHHLYGGRHEGGVVGNEHGLLTLLETRGPERLSGSHRDVLGSEHV